MRTHTHTNRALSKKAIWNNAVFEGPLPGQREWRWGSKQRSKVHRDEEVEQALHKHPQTLDGVEREGVTLEKEYVALEQISFQMTFIRRILC